MSKTVKTIFAAALILGSASAALAEDSSSSYDKQLGNGYTRDNGGMVSSSVALRQRHMNGPRIGKTSRKAMDRASQIRDGGAE